MSINPLIKETINRLRDEYLFPINVVQTAGGGVETDIHVYGLDLNLTLFFDNYEYKFTLTLPMIDGITEIVSGNLVTRIKQFTMRHINLLPWQIHLYNIFTRITGKGFQLARYGCMYIQPLFRMTFIDENHNVLQFTIQHFGHGRFAYCIGPGIRHRYEVNGTDRGLRPEQINEIIQFIRNGFQRLFVPAHLQNTETEEPQPGVASLLKRVDAMLISLS